jgi:hypothetical protein
VGKGKRADVYLEVRKRRGYIFFNETSACDFIPSLKTKTDFMWIFFYFCNV